MGFLEIFLIGIGLSMDAFAVSVCKGLCIGKTKTKHLLLTGLYFGGFQALMPLIGFFLGKQFEHVITNVDHWIVFGLLVIIGANMLMVHDDDDIDCSFCPKSMLPLAIATSIDALAVGISLGVLGANIWLSVTVIGITTFILSGIGVKAGSIFGTRYKRKAEIAGGIVLIFIGIKILFEHLGTL